MIYCNVLSDDEILQTVEKYNKVAIVYCISCANSSIAHQKNLPYYEIVTDDTTGKPALGQRAIEVETSRIKKMLVSHGFEVQSVEYGNTCLVARDYGIPERINGQGREDRLLDACSGSDAVLSLACSVGVLGLRRRLGDEKPVLTGMKTLGISSFDIKLNEEKNRVFIDKETSQIIYYSKT